MLLLNILGGLLGLVVLYALGYIQVTWGMSPEEKQKFNEYIEKNGFLGNDDF